MRLRQTDERDKMSRHEDYELIKRVAVALCREDGHDPFGPTCDICIPGDPDSVMPWASYRDRAREAIWALEWNRQRINEVDQ